MILETFTPEETFALGRKLGEKALPGQVYSLEADLGAGKTVFSQGFAAGLGVSGPVCSPTFTILMKYSDGRLPLYHFDVYRITDIEEMEEIGYSEFFYDDGVCLVEWGSLIKELLPQDCITVRIEMEPEKGSDYRKIYIEDQL